MAKTKPYMSDVVPVTDGMESHKGTRWDQKKRCYIGRVDYDTALPEAGDNLVTEGIDFHDWWCNRSLETSKWLPLAKQDLCI